MHRGQVDWKTWRAPVVECWAMAAASAVIAGLVVIALLLPKSVDWDSGQGLLCVEQFDAGRSPGIRTIVVADPEDLSRDRQDRVSWWAPGYQAIPWACSGFGRLPLGVGLRIATALSLVAGGVGWFAYFVLLAGDWRQAAWLFLAVALSFFCWQSCVTYHGGDQIWWAAAPWGMIAQIRAAEARRGRAIAAAAAGAFVAALFLLKYSAAMAGLGLAAGWVVLAVRDKRRWPHTAAWLAAFFAVLFTIHLSGIPGGPTPMTSAGSHLNPRDFVKSLDLFIPGALDGHDVLRGVLDRLPPATASKTFQVISALPLLLLGIVLWRWRGGLRSSPGTWPPGDRLILALSAAGGEVLGTTASILVGGIVSMDCRLQRVAGLLLLPVFCRIWCVALNTGRGKWASVGMIALMVALPAALGPALNLGAIRDRWRMGAQSATAEGIVAITSNDPETAYSRFFGELDAALPGKDAVIYTSEPSFMLGEPNRRHMLAVLPDQTPLAQLRQHQYRGVPTGGVGLLLPTSLSSERLEIIERSFPEIDQWHARRLSGNGAWTLTFGLRN